MAGLVQGGPGEMITPEEAARRRKAASPEGMNDYAAQTYPVKKKPPASPNNQHSEARKRAEYHNTNNPLDGLSYSVLNGRTVYRQDKWNWTHGQTDWQNMDGSPAGPYKKQDDKAEIPKATSRPFVSGSERGSLPAGQFTGPFQRYRSDGKGGETPVNVVRQGQGATLGGKRVTADGKGGWRDNTGSLVGEYRPGEDRTAVPKPMADLRGSQAPGSMTPAAATAFTPKPPETKKPPETTTEEASVVPERPTTPGSDGQETSALTGGRGDTRIDSRGNIQKGTNTSPPPMTMDDASKLLSGGYKIENPYSSNQLPTTASSPYAGKSNSQIYNPDTLHQHNSDVDYVSLSKDIYGDQSGVELATRNGGMKADYQQMDVNPGQQAPEGKINWANRTMADNSDEKVRRRSAMLDGNVGIMQAMRNQEAIQGRVYAGGKHYQVNKNKGQEGENDFVEISASQARDRSWGNQSADEVFANHLGKAKETAASTDIPDVPKDTPAMLPGAVPHSTSIDKSPFDTSELLGGTQSPPNMESIIDDDKPYVGMQKYNPFR